jgi:hypothetical protein
LCTHSFARNFVDYNNAVKKTAPELKKETKETKDNLTKILIVLFIVGGLVYTYTKIS